MLHGSNLLAVFRLVFLHLAMAYKLFAGLRMLPFGETGKLFRTDATGKAELVRKLALPFTLDRIALLPIVLLGLEMVSMAVLYPRKMRFCGSSTSSGATGSCCMAGVFSVS
jgi:hypothetical protein